MIFYNFVVHQEAEEKCNGAGNFSSQYPMTHSLFVQKIGPFKAR